MYGAAEMDDTAENIWLDVTTPMQALVHNSQLHIPGGDTKVMDEPLSYPILCWFHDFLTSCRLLCRVSRTLHLLLPSLCEFATCSADACIMRRFLTTCLWFCLWQVCFHVLSLCFSFISDLGPIFFIIRAPSERNFRPAMTNPIFTLVQCSAVCFNMSKQLEGPCVVRILAFSTQRYTARSDLSGRTFKIRMFTMRRSHF